MAYIYSIYHYGYCINALICTCYIIITDGVFIRNLCLLRENNIVLDDDQDLTSIELTCILDQLCTL